MLLELADKLPDMIIALVFGVISGLICLLVDRQTKGHEGHAGSAAPRSVTLTHVVEVSRRIVTRQPSPGGVEPASAMLVVAASIAYLRHQDDVLFVAGLSALFLLGLWFTVAVYSLVAGHVEGLRWPAYLFLMMSILAIGSFSVLRVAIAPTMLPAGLSLAFDQWQPFAVYYGAGRLLRVLGWQGTGWLCVHVLGVAAYFLALKQAALSMVFYAAAGSGKLSHDNRGSWLIRLAASHARPFRTLVSVAALMLAAYWFASGSAFFWLTQEMPLAVNGFMREVIDGKAG